MAYFEDTSAYCYHWDAVRPTTRNVGWLDSAHQYPRAAPSPAFLAALWRLCGVSVAKMRGLHACEFCPPERSIVLAEREGEKLLLGSSECRAFGERGEIWAAPTLVYHYVESHSYSPPREFIDAVLSGPAPPSPVYFDKLQALGLEWGPTSAPSSIEVVPLGSMRCR